MLCRFWLQCGPKRRRSAAADFAGIAGSNPTGVYGYLSLVSVVCCQVEVSATGRSLVQRSLAGSGV